MTLGFALFGFGLGQWGASFGYAMVCSAGVLFIWGSFISFGE